MERSISGSKIDSYADDQAAVYFNFVVSISSVANACFTSSQVCVATELLFAMSL